mmetsp:Transcript_82007/g.220233  ORF Transcript_82007/g.220233 Transcript_82007/m.220233 type:complete len:122 (-) Transcript_82007:798-1163(-)
MAKRVRFADQVQSISGRDRPPTITRADKDLLEYERKALMAAQRAEEARSMARSIAKGGQRSGSPSATSPIPRSASVDEAKHQRIQDKPSPALDTDPNFLVASMSWINDIFAFNQPLTAGGR